MVTNVNNPIVIKKVYLFRATSTSLRVFKNDGYTERALSFILYLPQLFLQQKKILISINFCPLV